MKQSARGVVSFASVVLVWVVWLTVQYALSVCVTASDIPVRLGYRYTDIGVGFGLPEWVGVRANFDGVNFMTIAREGYSVSQIAFFPLFPLIVSLFSILLSDNTLLAGVILAACLSCAGLLVWHIVYRMLFDPERSLNTLISLLLFPTAFFLISVYTESLFIVLLGLYVWALARSRWWVLVGVGVGLGLTRLAGVLAVLIPLTLYISLCSVKKRLVAPPPHLLFAILSPLVGLGSYMAYLLLQSGDAMAFLTVQTQFHNARSTSIVLLPQVMWRYMSIFFTARWDLLYFVALVECAVFVCVSTALVYAVFTSWKALRQTGTQGEHRQIYLGLVLFSIANLLLPTLTGTLSSIPRYALVGMGLYPLIAHSPRRVRYVIWLCSGLLQVALFALFAKGYFVS